MSQRKYLYLGVWKNYVEKLKVAVKLDLGEGFQVRDDDFEKAGNRKKYGFRIEVKNGKVVNDISGSAVARDLAYLLLDDVSDKRFLAGKHFFIRMSDAFYLEIYPVELYNSIKSGKLS